MEGGLNLYSRGVQVFLQKWPQFEVPGFLGYNYIIVSNTIDTLEVQAPCFNILVYNLYNLSKLGLILQKKPPFFVRKKGDSILGCTYLQEVQQPNVAQ